MKFQSMSFWKSIHCAYAHAALICRRLVTKLCQFWVTPLWLSWCDVCFILVRAEGSENISPQSLSRIETLPPRNRCGRRRVTWHGQRVLTRCEQLPRNTAFLYEDAGVKIKGASMAISADWNQMDWIRAWSGQQPVYRRLEPRKREFWSACWTIALSHGDVLSPHSQTRPRWFCVRMVHIPWSFVESWSGHGNCFARQTDLASAHPDSMPNR